MKGGEKNAPAAVRRASIAYQLNDPFLFSAADKA
jgi:hypothetical protein